MKPPCGCDAGRRDPGCRVCWLYENDPRYRLLWDGEPTAARMAASFAAAVGGHVLSGMKGVSGEVREARLAACRACDVYRAATDSCRLCGCNVSVKTRWASSRCPVGKWGATDGEPEVPGGGQ